MFPSAVNLFFSLTVSNFLVAFLEHMTVWFPWQRGNDQIKHCLNSESERYLMTQTI